ncbi:hypothetical protein C8Q80DRAFT_1268991 [Daedaleopsis nitida]|nr:hypothetical protein C8Q80DRAFT_1268991 [Daedaleopsis nitida]
MSSASFSPILPFSRSRPTDCQREATPMDSPFQVLASHPFNRPDADVVLQSTDGVEFRVRSHILVEASPVLERVISEPSHLPRAGGAALAINFDADSSTLDALLRMCYPIRKGRVARAVDECLSALRTAMAYEMELPVEALEDELVAVARRGAPHALKVWAGACRLRLESLARRAAECLFGDGPLDVALGSLAPADFDGLTAGDVFRLRKYRRVRGQVGPDFSLLPPLPPLQAAMPLEIDVSPEMDVPPEQWPVDEDPIVPGMGPHLDFRCVSSDGVRFAVNREAVSNASAYIKHVISESLERTCASGKKMKNSRLLIPSSISLEETSTVLSPLLSLCCSQGESRNYPTTPAELLSLLSAAERLSMNAIAQDLRARWDVIAKENPLRAYFSAVRERGQEERARLAARYALGIALDQQYLPEMDTEQCPALPYLRLANYYDACRGAAKNLLAAACHPTAASLGTQPRQVEAKPASVLPVAAVVDMSVPRAAPVPATTVSSPDSGVLWLSTFVSGLSGQIDNLGPECGGLMSSGKPEHLFEQAAAQGRWCPSCDKLAQGLSRVGRALRLIPTTIDSISLEL